MVKIKNFIIPEVFSKSIARQRPDEQKLEFSI